MPRRLNAAWHERHPLPKPASLEQRIAWHREHARHCGCRPVPEKLRALVAATQSAQPISGQRSSARGSDGRSRRYVAFLRGVSPMNAKMPELQRCFVAAGFSEVRTVRSSGNVVFAAKPAPLAQLAKQAEAAMKRKLGRSFLTIIRPVDALEKLLASEPFAAHRLPSDAKRVVTFLRGTPQAKLALPIELHGARILAIQGAEIFSAYRPSPRGAAFMVLIEKTFGAEVTTRTWDTIKKVVE